MAKYMPQIATTVICVIFAVANQKGYFLWIPDSVLLVVGLGALAVWLLGNRTIRRTIDQRSIGPSIFDEHGKEIRRHPRIRPMLVSTAPFVAVSLLLVLIYRSF